VLGDDEGMRITFDKDGNPVLPEQTKGEPETVKEQIEIDLSLPDPTMSISDMNTYGYMADDMLPLTRGRALELFNTDHAIYVLFSDDTEILALESGDIHSYGSDHILGITNADWERSPVRAAQLAIAANANGSREAELLHGDGDRLGIYQLKDGDETRAYRFEPLDRLHSHGLEIERKNYELIYVAPMENNETQANLNKIYNTFNTEHPAEFTGHSLSVSDIIVLKQNGNISSHYVDDVGFEELRSFLGNETPKPQAVEAAKEPYSQVGNTPKKEPSDIPKGRPSLMDRVEKGKEKVTQQGQPDMSKANNREV